MTEVRPEQGAEQNHEGKSERHVQFDQCNGREAISDRTVDPKIHQAGYIAARDQVSGHFQSAHPDAKAMFLEAYAQCEDPHTLAILAHITGSKSPSEKSNV
jgi:hypothetical protein